MDWAIIFGIVATTAVVWWTMIRPAWHRASRRFGRSSSSGSGNNYVTDGDGFGSSSDGGDGGD